MKLATSWLWMELLVGLLFVCAVDAQLPQFTSSPALLIKGAPFRVTTTSTLITSVFISRTADCSSIATGGSTVPLVGGSATFTVSSDPESVFFLCDAASSIAVRNLQLNPITYEPQFLFRATPSTLTFSEAIPAFARIQLRSYGDCVTGVADFDGTITSNKSVTVTMESAIYYFVCIQFASSITGQPVTLNSGNVLVTEAVEFTPQSGIKGDTAIFELSGAAPPFTNVIISSTTDCSTPIAGPLAATGTFGKTVATTLSMERGSWDFCVETPLNSNIFVSAGKVQVLEYGLTPRTVFQGRPTSITLTLDSPTSTDVVLTQSSNCLPPFVAGPTVPSAGSFTWTLSIATGTYIACVKKSSISTDYVIAGEVQLVPSYTVTVGTIPSVVGVPNAISVSPNPTTRVILSSTSDCGTSRVDVTTSSSQAQFVVASSSPDVLTICTYTLDGTGLYSVGTLTVRPFQLTFDPVIAGVPSTFSLDASAPVTSNFRFAALPDCTSSLAESTVPVSKTIEATISTSGITYACLEGVGVFRSVATFQTNPQPTLSPADVITGVSSPLLLQNPTGGVEWRVGTNCSHVLASTTTEFLGNSSMPVVFPEGGDYSSCLGLADSQGAIQFIEVGKVTAFTITISPPIHATSKPTTLRFFNVPSTLDTLLLNSVMFLVGSTLNCPSSSTSAFPTFRVEFVAGASYYQAVFMQNTSGLFKVCVSIGNQVLHVGDVSVIVPINTTFSDSVLLLNVPFAFTVNDPYVPNRYEIVSSVDDCSAPAIASGNFRIPGGSSELVSINEIGMYALCISSVDGSTMLWNDLVIIEQFAPLTTSLIRSIPNTLRTLPDLPGYSLFISPTTSCDGTTYISDENNALTAPAGFYYMCATRGTGWNTAGRPGVQVLDPFLGEFPSLIRVNVSFNVSLEGGDLANTPFSKLCVSTSPRCNCVEEGSSIFVTTQNATDFSARRFGQVTVSSPRFEVVFVCALSFDETAGMSLGSVNPQPYMNPFSIAKGSLQWVVSGALESGYAIITRDMACSFPLSSSVPVVGFNASQLFVAQTVSLDSGFYCEGLFPTGPFSNRGAIALLSPFNPNATSPTPVPGLTPTPPDNNTFINVTDGKITVSAATPFELNIPASVGSDPFVSSTADCLSKIPTAEQFGIFPVEGGQSSFFICATSPDGSRIFTNPEPSITVEGFSSNVRSLQLGEPTELIISPAAGLKRATNNRFFLSRTSGCTEGLEGSNDMTLDSQVVFGRAGLVFVCVTVGSEIYGIKSLAVFEAPKVVNSSAAVRGFPVCSHIALNDLNYSLAATGSDDGLPLSSYFSSKNRSTFLSSDLIGCSVSNSPQVYASFVGSDSTTSYWTVCHDSSMIVDLSILYTVCIGTPVRPIPATQGAPSFRFSPGTHLSFKEGTPVPVDHVSGVLSPILIAPLPETNFHLAPNDLSCDQPIGPTFVTDATGASLLLSSEREAPLALSPGVYTLCALHQSTWWPISSVNLFSQQFFAISNNVLVAGSTTTLELLGDLNSDAVYGLAFDGSSCMDATNSSTQATLTRPTSKTVAIVGQQDFTSAVLCARAAVNNTLFGIELIKFISNPIQFPANVPACVDFTLGFSYLEDANPTTDLLLYQDPCCLASFVPERVVATSNIIQTQETLRTMQVPRTKILEISPQVTFNLCLRNTSMCLDVGTITMDDLSRCELTLIPETSRPLSQARFVGGAAPQASDENPSDTIWIIVIFFIILLLIILIIIIYAKMRSSKVVPEDAQVQAEDSGIEESVTWKKAFDTMFMESSKGTARRDPRNVQSILHVPIDMNLDICREMPLENQALVTEEEEERERLLDDEAFCFQQILDSWALGISDAQASSSIKQRTQLLRHVLSIHERELGLVEDEEADSRYTFNIEEEQVRLAIAESERQAWRVRMQQDSQRLQEEKISRVNFRSRTRRLQDGSSKMFQHLDAAAPALRSPSRSRQNPTESFQDPNAVPLSPHPVSVNRRLDNTSTNPALLRSRTRSDAPVFSSIDEQQGRYAQSLRELSELHSHEAQEAPQDQFSFTDGVASSRRHRSRYNLE